MTECNSQPLLFSTLLKQKIIQANFDGGHLTSDAGATLLREVDKRIGLIDEIIREPLGGAHRDPEGAAATLEKYIVRSLNELKRLSLDTLVSRRRNSVRNMGSFFEDAGRPVAPRGRRPGADVCRARAVDTAVPAHGQLPNDGAILACRR